MSQSITKLEGLEGERKRGRGKGGISVSHCDKGEEEAKEEEGGKKRGGGEGVRDFTMRGRHVTDF